MQYQPNFADAISWAQQWLKRNGRHLTTESWQGIHKPRDMYEAFDFALKVPLNVVRDITIDELQRDIKPNLPWADMHFEERMSGIPYNPPPSNEIWPFGTDHNKQHKKDMVFSHTYPERYWPKKAGRLGVYNKDNPAFKEVWEDNVNDLRGIRYYAGDLNDVINLLQKEPHTRQAYLPVWFPEDTGAVEGQRVPCTLGYLFRLIEGHLHITYKIRSCDFYRHFRDDIYFTCRLLISVLEELSRRSNETKKLHFNWSKVKLGYFKMQVDSFHVFGLESQKL